MENRSKIGRVLSFQQKFKFGQRGFITSKKKFTFLHFLFRVIGHLRPKKPQKNVAAPKIGG